MSSMASLSLFTVAELIYLSVSLRYDLIADIPEIYCTAYDCDAFSDRMSGIVQSPFHLCPLILEV